MRKKKKRKGFGYYFYAVVVLLLTIANITLAILLLTHVQETEVKGNNYSEKSDIIEWFEEDTLTRNSLYSFWKIKYGSYELPIYLEDIQLSFRAPWKIRLTVTEKEILAGMQYGDEYIYFDKEGLVMTTSTEALDGIYLIEGLVIVHNSEEAEIKQFERLQMLDEDIYTIIEKILTALDTVELVPDRIVWEDSSMNLYFGEVCVQLGKTNFSEKLTQLPPILEKEEIQGKAGILHMENYSKTGDSISFEPDQTTVQEDGEEGTGEDSFGEDGTGENTAAGDAQNEEGQNGALGEDGSSESGTDESGTGNENETGTSQDGSDAGETGLNPENSDDYSTEPVE